MTHTKLDPTLYILTTLKQNGEVYNFIRLDGRQFKNETERFAIIDTLVQDGSISRVQGAIGQTYRLTDNGNNNLYKMVFKKVLQHLADNSGTFHHVSDILKELSIPDTNDELSNAIDLKLRHDNMVFATEESGVMLNEKGRHILAEQKFSSQSSFDRDSNLPTQAANAPTTSKDQKGKWILKILSNNWTITIVGGIIAGLAIAYFVFVFKWNK